MGSFGEYAAQMYHTHIYDYMSFGMKPIVLGGMSCVYLFYGLTRWMKYYKK